MKKIVPLNAVLIPDNATSVFKGVLFEVFQWPQKLYDGSTKTFEMLRRPDAVDILVIRNDQILVLQDEQPNRHAILSLPGGRVDDGEDWSVAARRELKEETGIVCGRWTLVDVQQPLHKIEWFIPIYVASDITKRSQQKLDGGEKIQLNWRNYQEFREAVIEGREPDLAYLAPLLRRVSDTDMLIDLPVFAGNELEVQ